MINAKMARERTKSHENVPIEGVLTELQVYIEKACDRGEYSCRVPYPPVLIYNEELRSRVFSVLIKEGYEYKLDESASGHKYLTINWKMTTSQSYWYWES